jgi:hypothetical protein
LIIDATIWQSSAHHKSNRQCAVDHPRTYEPFQLRAAHCQTTPSINCFNVPY